MQKPVFFTNSVTRDNFNKAITEIAQCAYESKHNETFYLALELSNQFGATPQVTLLAILAANNGWDFKVPSETWYRFQHYSSFRAEEWMKIFADVIEIAAETVHNWEQFDRKDDSKDHRKEVHESIEFIAGLIKLIKAIGLDKRETLALWDVKEQYFVFLMNANSFYQFHGLEELDNLFDATE